VTYRFLFWSTSELSKTLQAVVLFNMGATIVVDTSIRPKDSTELVQGVDATTGGRKRPVPLVGWVGIAKYRGGFQTDSPG